MTDTLDLDKLLDGCAHDMNLNYEWTCDIYQLIARVRELEDELEAATANKGKTKLLDEIRTDMKENPHKALGS